MKINWKVLIPSILVLVALFWTVDSVRPRVYSGTHLNVSIGDGTVTLTNATSNPVPAQLVGTGTNTFSVSSNTAGLYGSSVRQTDSSNVIAQVFAFTVPVGISTFDITRGSHVTFVGDPALSLTISVEPLNSGDATLTILVGLLVILGSLFYISRQTQHSWLKRFRHQATAAQVSERAAERESFKRRLGGITSDKP